MAANSYVDESSLTLNQSKNKHPPIVFQCKGCKNIIGDSSAFVSADQQLEVICVHAVTSLVSSSECLETSTEGADMGSTFRPLQCTSCNLVIGRVYRTTPKELDHLRNMFSFDVEQIQSYQIGSLSEMQSVSTEEILDIPTAKALETRIGKIECVILMLMERMGLAEGTMNKENDSTMATNQTSDAHMDCQDMLQQNEHSNSIKPNKKKRK